MESQNQEIVASGSPAEVPNDPGYERKITKGVREVVTVHHVNGSLRLQFPGNHETFHYIDHQRSTTRERMDRKGGRDGGGRGERERERERERMRRVQERMYVCVNAWENTKGERRGGKRGRENGALSFSVR